MREIAHDVLLSGTLFIEGITLYVLNVNKGKEIHQLTKEVSKEGQVYLVLVVYQVARALLDPGIGDAVVIGALRKLVVYLPYLLQDVCTALARDA